MFLGLAVLTAMAHVFAVAAYAVLAISLGRVVDAWPALLLALLGAAAPVLAAWWMLDSAPRAGAALFAASMFGFGAVLFGLHYVWDTPSHVAYLEDFWLDRAYGGAAYTLLLLEILGFGIGAVLAWRPERRVSAARETSSPAPTNAPP